MLSILFIWIYMGIILCIVGISILQVYQSVTNKICSSQEDRVPSLGYIIFLGIMGSTLYAQVYGIFWEISFGANILLLGMILVYILVEKKYIISLLQYWKNEIYEFLPDRFRGIKDCNKREKTIVYIVIIAAAICYGFASSGPAKLIDTDWYHAQAIRWLEEYGVVVGLGNLFPSLGYNNSQHYFDALFSMKWLLGQSMRTSGGFFGLVLFIHGILRVAGWRIRNKHVADMIAVWEIAYSIIVTAFYTDPYVDTLPNALVLVIFTEWMGRLEERREDRKAMVLDCLLCVFAVVCKLSVATVVLLAVHPLILLIKDKKWKEILIYLGMGTGVALPFLITSVMTSGYLIYPLAAVDLFPVPWKMDREILKYTVDSMIAFARMPLATMEEALNAGYSWIPVWFKNESASHKILYVSIIIMIIYDIGNMLLELLDRLKTKQLKCLEEEFFSVWPRICVYFGLLYWFFSIPQVKYCWAFLILPLAVIPMHYYSKEQRRYKILQRVILFISLAVFFIYTGFYSLRTLKYIKNGILTYSVMQADYLKFDLEEIEIDSHSFYIRKENGDLTCGYYAFPYLDNPENRDKIIIGKSLKEGIYFKE